MTTKGADGKPKPSRCCRKRGRAQFCDLTCTPDGTLHAIYTDRPSTSNFPYLYHRSSRDGGVTWSEPSNLSDDESGRMAAYCTLGHDAAGRVYAFWKYLDPNEILYGPGGYDGGVLVMRCWQAGTWLPRLALNQPTEPIFAWYTLPGRRWAAAPGLQPVPRRRHQGPRHRVGQLRQPGRKPRARRRQHRADQPGDRARSRAHAAAGSGRAGRRPAGRL
ncbi:MAG: glycoside hydrolase [Gammaproteobacteria bacterium]|nr:glycoside hydrolase [Gammaproteobacteria bacterium]